MKTKDERLGIGIVGLGHIGPNHARVFNQCEDAKVVVCADLDQKRRDHFQKNFPTMEVIEQAEEVFCRNEVDAVVIATPTKTHYALAKRALECGKHILLEKPMCTSLEEAKELVNLAKKLNLIIMHGHLVLYNRAVQFVREGVLRGDFGKIQYLHTSRTNLGPIRNDINVIQDLATHEFSIFDFIFGALPQWISAAGSRLLSTPREDVAFISMEYPDQILVHTHVSWLHPQKTRLLTLVGDKKMVVLNDMDISEPVKIYDKGIAEEPYYDSFGEFQMCLRDADVHIPKLTLDEPLLAQAQAFVNRILKGILTLSEAETGLRMMKCVEACQESLRQQGRRVYLEGGTL